MRITVIFDNFGPYHLARLRAAAGVCELTAIQISSRSAEYAWENKTELAGFNPVTLFQQDTSREVGHGKIIRKINEVLDACRPQIVFIPGWSGRAAFVALHWCVRNRIPAVAMSESTERDEKRTAWKEWMKRKLAGLFSAALAGGNPHKDYLVKLGMPAERIFLGYDAVDNNYFAQGAKEAGSRKPEAGGKHGLPENYFLASARFIEKKNLPRLLEAYARYRKLAGKSEIWDLVLLGDGALRETLNTRLSALNLRPHVQMPGFMQYPDLPVYYGCARAFIHASTTEQWGLVVNEAMASGLPVLVSNRCGCAMDLVREGKNGFTFDPHDVGQLAQLMLKISAFNFPLSAFGDASREIVARWGPERFAAGLRAAAESAAGRGAHMATLGGKILLKTLLLKP
jgi:1,2-diacylglycerol 3-alpha-glucosyltransferase